MIDDLSWALIGNIDLYFEAKIGLLSSVKVIFKLNFEDSGMIQTETAVDQNTTALAHSSNYFLYNISNFYSNPVGFSGPITYNVTLDDDMPLPSWISFNSATNIITISSNNKQNAVVKVTANNTQDTQSQTFEVNILNTPPTLEDPFGGITKYENISFTELYDLVPMFSEPDPNQSIVQYVLYFLLKKCLTPINLISLYRYEIAEWVSFWTCTISSGDILNVTGNPSMADIPGTNRVQITASDGFDKTLNILTINVIENEPPTVPNPYITMRTAFEGSSATVVYPEFDDTENDPITYSMTYDDGSPINSSWITFNPLNRALRYNPQGTETSPLTLVMYASDPYNPPTEAITTMVIYFKPKDNPSVVSRTGEFVWNSFSSFEISRNIITSDELINQYSITLSDGSPIPSWLQVSYPHQSASGDFQFSGTYPLYESILYEFTITATNVNGLSGEATFYIQTKRKIPN